MVNFSIKKHSQRFVNALSAQTGLGEIQYHFCFRFQSAWGRQGQGTAGLEDFLGLSSPQPPSPQQCRGKGESERELDWVFQL